MDLRPMDHKRFEDLDNSNRLRAIVMTDIDMMNFFFSPIINERVDYNLKCPDIPVGSKYVTQWHEPSRRATYVVFQHDSFDPIPPGQMIPAFPFHVMPKESVNPEFDVTGERPETLW